MSRDHNEVEQLMVADMLHMKGSRGARLKSVEDGFDEEAKGASRVISRSQAPTRRGDVEDPQAMERIGVSQQ